MSVLLLDGPSCSAVSRTLIAQRNQDQSDVNVTLDVQHLLRMKNVTLFSEKQECVLGGAVAEGLRRF